jgi:hypothetical protein
MPLPLLVALVAALIQLKGPPLSGGILSGSASIRLEKASGGDTPVLTWSSRAGVVRLLLDTGASSTLVTPALAQRLALSSQALSSQDLELGGGGSLCAALKPRRTRLPSLELAGLEQVGALRLSGIEALLLPVAALPPGIDGVLGIPSLRQLPLWIDPQHNRLAFGPAALQAARDHDSRGRGSWGRGGDRSGSGSFEAIPLRWRRGVPLLALNNPGASVSALADTGAEGLFISPALAARLQPQSPAQPLRLAGVCGEQAVELRRYGGLALQGADPARTVPAAVEAIRLENPIFAQLGVEAIVGQELLRNRPQLWRLERQPPRLELR